MNYDKWYIAKEDILEQMIYASVVGDTERINELHKQLDELYEQQVSDNNEVL